MITRVMQPSSCPVCHMHNDGPHKFTTLMKCWEDLTKVKFQCGFCWSIFWWRKETREACGLESRYPLTRAGWNTDVKYLDPKYEDGDVCPRCNANPDYKEDSIFGNGRCCVICEGSGVYTKK